MSFEVSTYFLLTSCFYFYQYVHIDKLIITTHKILKKLADKKRGELKN